METSDNRTLDEFLLLHELDQVAPLCPIGTKIDGWEICAFAGRGGSGEVYRVQKLAETVQIAALKILTKDDARSRLRFEQERFLLSRNVEKSLPHYFGAGEWGSHPYFVIEFLEPTPLPRSESQLADYLIGVCEALAPLHAKGIVHRDLKPANIMRRPGNEIVLVDFGLAKPVQKEGNPRQDISIVDGKIVAVGTPGYAAPEQMQGGEISPQTDIHALGMLIEKMRGSVGWEDEMPSSWHEILQRSTSSIPAERYSSVESLAAAVRNRHRPRFMRVAAAILVAAGLTSLCFVPGLLPRQKPSSVDSERQAFSALCSDLMTNVVSEALVRSIPVTNDYGGFQRVSYKRLSRVATNRVEGLLVSLDGAAHAFRHPIHLGDKKHCYIRGPGTLDASIVAEGEVVMHLSNCIWINPTRQPLAESKVVYSLEGGAGLFFPNLDAPKGSLERGCAMAIYDGADNQLKFRDSEGIDDLKKVRQILWESREYQDDGHSTMDSAATIYQRLYAPNRIPTEAEIETVAYCFDIPIVEARQILSSRQRNDSTDGNFVNVRYSKNTQKRKNT